MTSTHVHVFDDQERAGSGQQHDIQLIWLIWPQGRCIANSATLSVILTRQHPNNGEGAFHGACCIVVLSEI